MDSETGQERAPKSNRRRQARGAALAAVLALTATACTDKDSSRSDSTDSAQTAQVDATATRIPIPETTLETGREAIVRQVSNFTGEVTAFLLAQENNPNPDVHFEREPAYVEFSLGNYNTSVTRDVVGPDGKATRYTISMNQQATNPDTQDLRLHIITISEFPVPDPTNPSVDRHNDFMIIPLDGNGWRLGGAPSEAGAAPHAFHTTEAWETGSDERFQPISQEWLAERIAVSRDIMSQIAGE